MIDRHKIQGTFFVILFAAAAVLAVAVFLPFIDVMLLAVVLAVALQPIYSRVLKAFNGRAWAASLVTILITIIFILLPLIFVSTNIVRESQEFYLRLNSGRYSIDETRVTFTELLNRYLPNIAIDLEAVVGNVVSWITTHIGTVVSGALSFVIGIVLTLISLFFFLKDGPTFIKQVLELSPLEDRYDEQIMGTVTDTITAVVRGAFFVSIIQGILVGIGLAIFGVPSPTLWGSIAAITSLIPGIGTSIVTIPSVLYLVFEHQTGQAIGLAIWSVLLVGLVDNMLLPYLYRGKGKLHPLFVLFSVLGGLVAFGPFGFLFGPLTLSFFIALVRIYKMLVLSPGEMNTMDVK